MREHKCHQNRIVVTDDKLGTVRCCSVCGNIVPFIERVFSDRVYKRVTKEPTRYCESYGRYVYRVTIPGKKPCDFPYLWVAVSFAVYAFKHPQVMAERQ